MTACDRLGAVLGVLDDSLPYWLRSRTDWLAYVAGFICGLIDIAFGGTTVTVALSAAPQEGRENPPS